MKREVTVEGCVVVVGTAIEARAVHTARARAVHRVRFLRRVYVAPWVLSHHLCSHLGQLGLGLGAGTGFRDRVRDMNRERVVVRAGDRVYTERRP